MNPPPPSHITLHMDITHPKWISNVYVSDVQGPDSFAHVYTHLSRHMDIRDSVVYARWYYGLLYAVTCKHILYQSIRRAVRFMYLLEESWSYHANKLILRGEIYIHEQPQQVAYPVSALCAWTDGVPHPLHFIQEILDDVWGDMDMVIHTI